jgi:hypothetical protein
LASAEGFEAWLASFNTTQWVIRCPQVWDRRGAGEDPEATSKTVRYLANYANRVAVSNDRVVAIEGERVILRYKDYRDGDQWKNTSIDGVEFLERFLQHLLPKGLQHIRRYGWMARRYDNEKLDWLREYFAKLAAQEGKEPPPPEESPFASPHKCRMCGGHMELVEVTYRPKVSELLEMSLDFIRRFKRGAIVTLGPNLPDTVATGHPKAAHIREAVLREQGLSDLADDITHPDLEFP